MQMYADLFLNNQSYLTSYLLPMSNLINEVVKRVLEDNS
jgi:hypothetical protein